MTLPPEAIALWLIDNFSPPMKQKLDAGFDHTFMRMRQIYSVWEKKQKHV